MKVLIVHNRYRSTAPSGEDAVVANEVALLRDAGVEVAVFERRNDDIRDGAVGSLAAAGSTVWSPSARRELRATLERERPEVAHFHNLWYLISPSGYDACREAGVPVVQTLHNYRMFCANGLLLRDGRPCEDCVGRWPWRGVAHGCFRSRLHSVPLVASQIVHRLASTWTTRVDAFIALSAFSRDLFIRCGLPPKRVHVKPNFFAGEIPAQEADEGYALYLGRLSEEKGPDLLLDAARSARVPIKVIGDGPLRERLERDARSLHLDRVEFLGRKDHAESMRWLARSSFLVLPSRCYENFPMALVEAFACGKPVVAPDLGAPAELVEDGVTGLHFKAGDASDLAAKLGRLSADRAMREAMGARARSAFERRYGGEANLDALLSIYRAVTSGREAGGSRRD